MPFLCNYYVTLRCNARCSFCDIWQNKGNFGLREQSLQEIESNLRDLKKLGVRVIDFTGGEPLLYPHLIAALQLAKKYGFYTTVTTNCSLYPRYSSRLKGMVDMLFFSLQSADEKEHNRIAGIKSYQKVIESIGIAKQIKQKISLLHTVTDANVEKLFVMVKFAQKNKCMLRLNPCFSYFDNQQISKGSIPELLKYKKEPYVVMNFALLKLIESGGNKVAAPICKAVSSTIVISPDNYLMLPCYHHCCKKVKIENNLLALQSSVEVEEIRKKVGRFDFCKNCTITCYMRTSLLRKYPYLTLKSWVKSLREMVRRQF
jgi:MoaA/NifB/PqqE/SkfB family radical SAM enzyme